MFCPTFNPMDQDDENEKTMRQEIQACNYCSAPIASTKWKVKLYTIECYINDIK